MRAAFDAIRCIEKVTANRESEQHCELCCNITESTAIVWDLLAPTGASENTLSDVLNTSFTEEYLPATIERAKVFYSCRTDPEVSGRARTNL